MSADIGDLVKKLMEDRDQLVREHLKSLDITTLDALHLMMGAYISLFLRYEILKGTGTECTEETVLGITADGFKRNANDLDVWAKAICHPMIKHHLDTPETEGLINEFGK